MPVDAETIEALKQVHTDLELDEEGPYDLQAEEWVAAQARSSTSMLSIDIDALYEKFAVFTDKLSKKFKKSKAAIQEIIPEAGPECQPGDEMEQELTDAWNLFTRVGRIIKQNKS